MRPTLALQERGVKQPCRRDTQIVALKAADHFAQAEQEYRDVKPTSATIIERLTQAERKVLEYQNVNIVVLQADDRQFGLVVDSINDT